MSVRMQSVLSVGRHCLEVIRRWYESSLGRGVALFVSTSPVNGRVLLLRKFIIIN
jgi:hypothetical protein